MQQGLLNLIAAGTVVVVANDRGEEQEAIAVPTVSSQSMGHALVVPLKYPITKRLEVERAGISSKLDETVQVLDEMG